MKYFLTLAILLMAVSASARGGRATGSTLVSDKIVAASTNVTPKYVSISANTSGDNTILAAVTGKKIRILSLVIVSAGTVNIRLESGAGGTALTGVMPLVVNNSLVWPLNQYGYTETAAATLLNLELSAGVAVTGCLTYIEVD